MKTIKELRCMLDKKEVSSVELTKEYLDRADSLNGEVNAYITISRDEALDQACARAVARDRGDEIHIHRVLRVGGNAFLGIRLLLKIEMIHAISGSPEYAENQYDDNELLHSDTPLQLDSFL